MQVELMQANGLALDTLALLATYALHSSLLFGVAWLAGRALDSPRLRELLWKGALVGGLLTTGAQAVLGGGPLTLDFSALQASSWNAARIGGGSADDAQKSIIGIHGGAAAGLVDGATTPLAVRGSTEVQHAAPLDAGQASELELAHLWPLALFVLWAIGAGIGLNHIRRERKALLGALRTPVKRGALREQLRILEPSLGREIELWSTPGVSSPMAIGRSAICVPRYALHDLDAQSQTALLAHEVEHLRRRDGAWLFLARALQALFPFQPLQRLAIAHMGHEAELLCDEAALRSTGNGVALARCLVLVAERLTGPALPSFSVAMATQSSPLMHRIQRVLGTPPPTASRSGVLLLTALGSAALLALACSGPGVSAGSNAAAEDEVAISAADNEPAASAGHDELAASAADVLPLLEGDLRVQLIIAVEGERYLVPAEGEEPSQPWTGQPGMRYVYVGRSIHWSVNGVTLTSKDTFDAYMKRLGAEDASRVVVIEAGSGIVYADVVPVLDSLITANLTEVGFAGTYDNGEGGLGFDPVQFVSVAAPRDVNDKALERLAALGYVEAESETSVLSQELLQELEALGYVEVKPELPAPEEGQLKRLAALGYVEVEPELPAIVVKLTAKGSVLVNGEPMADFGKRGTDQVVATLKPLVRELARTPLTPNSDLLAVNAPLRMTASARTHFSQLLQIMTACGYREVMIPNLQLDLEFEDGSREVFAYTLPSGLDLEPVVEEVEGEGEELRDTGPRTPTIHLRNGKCLAQLPGQDARVLALKDVDAFISSEFLAYMNRAHDDREQRSVTLSLGTGTTVAEVAQLLHVLKRAGMMERVLFTGTFE